MSRRDTDRERDSRRSTATSVRTNEYFVPKDGIDREVITADICRYLGNDALVRPGTYENRETRQSIPGYFITAYRNLTTAMIADLKADSSRWDDERRATSSRGQPANGIRDSNGNIRKSNIPAVGYRDSNTHHTRQYYGPTESGSTPSGSSGYTPSSTASGVSQQEVYPQGYGSGPNYTQPGPGYGGGPPSGYGAPHQPDNYSYVAGANFSQAQEPDMRGGRGGPIPPAQSVPRASPGYPPQPPVSYPDTRGNVGGGYYNSQVGQPASAPYAPQSSDYYGRHSTYNDDYISLVSSTRKENSLTA
jgi:hypothetical protein